MGGGYPSIPGWGYPSLPGWVGGGYPSLPRVGGYPSLPGWGGTLHCLGGGYPSLPATCFGLSGVSAVLWEQVTCELFTVGTFF